VTDNTTEAQAYLVLKRASRKWKHQIEGLSRAQKFTGVADQGVMVKLSEKHWDPVVVSTLRMGLDFALIWKLTLIMMENISQIGELSCSFPHRWSRGDTTEYLLDNMIFRATEQQYQNSEQETLQTLQEEKTSHYLQQTKITI
jgi:hypothetical protein